MIERPSFINELGSVMQWAGGLFGLSGLISAPFGILVGPLLIFCPEHDPLRLCAVGGVLGGGALFWLGQRFRTGARWSYPVVAAVLCGALLADVVSSVAFLSGIVHATSGLGGSPAEHEANARSVLILSGLGLVLTSTLFGWLLWRLQRREIRQYFRRHQAIEANRPGASHAG
jgi:hypothetical protein